MGTKETLVQLMDGLTPVRQYEVLDFARYLCWLEQREKQEREDWHRFGMGQLAKAYGPDEPEYTEADVKQEAKLCYSVTADNWQKNFDAWMAAVKVRAHRYPPGFVMDDSRESIYEGCGR